MTDETPRTEAEPMTDSQAFHYARGYSEGFRKAIASLRDQVAAPQGQPLDVVLASLTDEDEIAHGEAWDDVNKRGLGVCAYCDGEWPCRTQRGIDRLLARLRESGSPGDDR